MSERLKGIGYSVRKTRERLDYSQQDIAEKLGITAGAYAKLERAEVDITITRLYELAEIFKVDIEQLIKSPEELSKSSGYVAQADFDLLYKMVAQINKRVDQIAAKRISKGK